MLNILPSCFFQAPLYKLGVICGVTRQRNYRYMDVYHANFLASSDAGSSWKLFFAEFWDQPELEKSFCCHIPDDHQYPGKLLVIQLLYISTMTSTTWSNLELVNLRLDPNVQTQLSCQQKYSELQPGLCFVNFLFFEYRSLCCLREWFEYHLSSTVVQVLHGQLRTSFSFTSQPWGGNWEIGLWRYLLIYRRW
jgi:hypothetical protein